MLKKHKYLSLSDHTVELMAYTVNIGTTLWSLRCFFAFFFNCPVDSPVPLGEEFGAWKTGAELLDESSGQSLSNMCPQIKPRPR